MNWGLVRLSSNHPTPSCRAHTTEAAACSTAGCEQDTAPPLQAQSWPSRYASSGLGSPSISGDGLQNFRNSPRVGGHAQPLQRSNAFLTWDAVTPAPSRSQSHNFRDDGSSATYFHRWWNRRVKTRKIKSTEVARSSREPEFCEELVSHLVAERLPMLVLALTAATKLAICFT